MRLPRLAQSRGTALADPAPGVDVAEDPNSVPEAAAAPVIAPADAPRVLVVEDDPVLLTILSRYLGQRGCCVLGASSAAEALELFAHTPIDVTVSDVRMPGMSGHELLQEVRRRDPEADLILITAHSSVKEAVAAIRSGAADYLEKPVDCRRLHHTIQIIAERRRLRQRVRILELGGRDSTVFEGMVARSRRMLEVFSFIERIADFPTTTLILGESGTGKELVARAVHQRSPLRDRPFVVCNCSVLASGLIESELFGHVRGAFTGADRDHKGLFETANGGTIFLDELGELPLGAQVKLLRVLENREIRRVGSPTSVPVEIRVVAATNRDLGHMVRDGEFREDLFYRLNVGVIELPPLRERLEDLELLCEHFLTQFARRFALDKASVSAGAMQAMRSYHWPGNVRELSNALERASIMANGGEMQLEHLPIELRRTTEAPEKEEEEEVSTLDLSLEAAERDQIRRALDSAGGRRVAAARLLGLSRRTLYRKLDKYGIR
ncbi:MAG: sigma-54-dependent Fis family transcriptional regulator [Deltaproteobacteria bacterium]|nr:sigma-54-dependent Fis family transcriptional regulator [Deltaproteobacteria bacterium]